MKPLITNCCDHLEMDINNKLHLVGSPAGNESRLTDLQHEARLCVSERVCARVCSHCYEWVLGHVGKWVAAGVDTHMCMWEGME